MAASFTIDQATLAPAGVADQSRSDGLAGGQLVTLASVGGGSTHDFTLLWVPEADTTAESSLTAPTSTTATFSPTVGARGTYRIELVVDAGLATEDRVVRLFSVRTAAQSLRIPALNERASPNASLVLDGTAEVDASEDNEPLAGGPFAAGNYAGWYRAQRELYDAVEATVSGGLTLTAVQVAGFTVGIGFRGLYDPTGGSFTIDATAGPSTGDLFGVKNVTVDTTAVTIDGDGTNIEDPFTQTIVASFSTTALGKLFSGVWVFDGTNWVLI